ncbi:MAG: sulfatase-like hydrolase/transferase, partial [Armatimonadota bacterium]
MKRPNVLIVMTDHQRADTVLPEHPAVAPNVARLAEQGVTFTNVHAPMAHCCPARASFFSGLYPSRHGVWNNVNNGMALARGLNPGVRLYSEDLADAGHNLAYVGKWHVSAVQAPRHRGWRELQSYPALTIADEQAGWEQLREAAKQPDPPERAEGEILMPGYRGHRLYGRNDRGHPGDERSLELALKALPELAESGDPWSLFVGWGMPHAPYTVPQRYLDLYDLDDVPLPASYADTLEDKPNYYRKLREMRFGQLDERQTREAIRHFWAMCTYLDEMFGKLL